MKRIASFRIIRLRLETSWQSKRSASSTYSRSASCSITLQVNEKDSMTKRSTSTGTSCCIGGTSSGRYERRKRKERESASISKNSVSNGLSLAWPILCSETSTLSSRSISVQPNLRLRRMRVVCWSSRISIATCSKFQEPESKFYLTSVRTKILLPLTYHKLSWNKQNLPSKERSIFRIRD